MRVKPLFDRVLLEVVPSESETKSGIILPTPAQEKSQIAVVVEVGQGAKKLNFKSKKETKSFLPDMPAPR